MSNIEGTGDESTTEQTTTNDTRITGASGVDGPAAENGTYGDTDRATAGSLDGTPDETS